MRFPRAAIIVLDGVGCGGAPDARSFGDEGSDTLGNTARAVGGLHLPNLAQLGLGKVAEIPGVPGADPPAASWGRMRPASAGKDTTSGHWEIAGVILERPFPTYPLGFPEEVLARFREIAGADPLGNEAASGTEIIQRLGEEHVRTGRPIVYTSADSVLQIAAHEDVLAPEALRSLCRRVRAALPAEHAVGRVIARPFRGTPGSYERTAGRRDFSLPPPGTTLLDAARAAGHEVVAVGKIDDIFAARGITRSEHVLPTAECMEKTAVALRDLDTGIVFTNLIEFDMDFGHRNDPAGMARALEGLDARVPDLLEAAGEGAIVAFTADHGNDPTTPSTDHSREEVPVLVWTGGRGAALGIRSTFADLGATIAESLGLPAPTRGVSFLADLPGLD